MSVPGIVDVVILAALLALAIELAVWSFKSSGANVKRLAQFIKELEADEKAAEQHRK